MGWDWGKWRPTLGLLGCLAWRFAVWTGDWVSWRDWSHRRLALEESREPVPGFTGGTHIHVCPDGPKNMKCLGSIRVSCSAEIKSSDRNQLKRRVPAARVQVCGDVRTPSGGWGEEASEPRFVSQ